MKLNENKIQKSLTCNTKEEEHKSEGKRLEE